MFVSVSLLSFAFDKAKSGEILSEWLAAAGYNNHSQTARLVGMTDDMLYNVLSGRNKEISLDRVFKLCTLTGHTVDEFVNQLLNGMDTDFPIPVSVYITDPPRTAETSPQITGKTVNMESIGMLPSEFNHYVEHLDLHNEKMLDRFKIVHENARQQMAEQYHASLQRYEQQITIINQEHEKSVSEIKSSYEKTISLLTSQNKRLRRTSWIIFALFLLETLGILGVFVYDSLHPDVGFIRHTFSRFFNRKPIDTLYS